jgi:hypothetical protein
MNAIYSIITAPGATLGSLSQQWAQQDTGLSAGYTTLTPVLVAGKQFLFAYNKTAQQLDAYVLSGSDPWIQQAASKANVGQWDILDSFVLGNVPYLVAYRADTGRMAFFGIAGDLGLSPPYMFAPSHTTPSDGFTTLAAYTSLNQQYLLGYSDVSGRVENFSASVTPCSTGGVPPLLVVNVWFHQWAKGWGKFAFFQLGGSVFFFKINKQNNKVLNVNIDHMQDNPAMGSIEVATDLKQFLPDAESIDLAAMVPWANSDPYLLTYIAASGKTAIYQIHSDCLGLTPANPSTAIIGASSVIPYQIGNTSYVLMYQSASAAKPP